MINLLIKSGFYLSVFLFNVGDYLERSKLKLAVFILKTHYPSRRTGQIFVVRLGMRL